MSAAVASCTHPCREGGVLLREPPMSGDLIQKGKYRFVPGGCDAEKLSAGVSGGIVVYEDLP